MGDRLGALVRKLVANPFDLAAVNSRTGGEYAFLRAGLLLRAGSTPRAARASMVPSGRLVRNRSGMPHIYGVPGGEVVSHKWGT